MMMLKPQILEDLTKKELRSKLLSAVNVTDQSLRLWVLKKDIRLLCYPIMLKLAEHYAVNIPNLVEEVPAAEVTPAV